VSDGTTGAVRNKAARTWLFTAAIGVALILVAARRGHWPKAAMAISNHGVDECGFKCHAANQRLAVPPDRGLVQAVPAVSVRGKKMSRTSRAA
jgi:hypothetical protein